MAPAISLKAETLFHIGNFTITNSLLTTFIAVTVILAIVGLILKKGLQTIPASLQNIAEVIMEEILNLMDSVLGSRHLSEKYFPFIASIFLFVITSNWLGLFPGVGSLLVKESHETIPLLRAPGADLNFTLALGIASILVIHWFGIASLGFKNHSKKFLNFQSPVMFFVGILEFISEFAKIVSFSFRLFGNVFAGEVLLAIVAFLIPYIIPLPFLFLEVFVGFVQALIFSMLALVFLGTTLAHSDH